MEQEHELLQRQHSGIWRSLRDGDFEEEEVWDVVNEKTQYNNKKNNNNSSGIFKTKQSLSPSPSPSPSPSFSSSSSFSSSVPLSVPRPLPSASRMIPKANSSNNIHTSTYNSAIEGGKVLQQSAPLNIPDWSKIYNINNKKQNKRVSRLHDYDFAAEEDDYDEEGYKNEQVIKYGGGNFYEQEAEDEEEEEDEYDEVRLPPHEFIARRLARTQISSFSVFEGVGRTLKGRDLSKVRNAVLTRTGFLESL